MCGTIVANFFLTINNGLGIQGQMATDRHLGETDLTVAHLVTQIRGIEVFESKDIPTELVGGGRRYRKYIA